MYYVVLYRYAAPLYRNFPERCGIDTTVEWIQKVDSDRDNLKTIAKRVMSEVDDYIPLYIYTYIYIIGIDIALHKQVTFSATCDVSL